MRVLTTNGHKGRNSVFKRIPSKRSILRCVSCNFIPLINTRGDRAGPGRRQAVDRLFVDKLRRGTIRSDRSA